MLQILKNGSDITQQVSNLFLSKTRQIATKVVINANGEQIAEFTNHEIIEFSVEEQIITGDKFAFGTANSSVLELILNDVGDIYNADALVNAQVQLYLVVDYNGKVDVPMGTFTIDTAYKNGNKITLSGFDNVMFTEENYNLQTAMTYPCSIVNIVEEIETISGVTIDKNFFYNDYQIKDGIVFNSDCTCRTVLQNIAELCCGFLRADRYGRLKILNIVDTIAATIEPSNYFKFEYNKHFGPIASVYLTTGSGESAKDVIVGDPEGLQFQIRNNIYLQGDLQPIAEKIYGKVNGLTYIPGNLTFQGNPIIEVGDYINVKDKFGRYQKLLVTYQKFTYNGSLKCELRSTGRSDLSIATDRKEIISESVEGLNNRVNQLTTWLDKTKLGFLLEQIDEFSGRLDGLDTELKKVQQSITPDGIVTTVTNSKTFKDTMDGINGAIDGLGNRTTTVESTIAQHADQINMSVKSDEVLNYINLDTSGATIHADKINLEGVVTFDDLSGAGQTIINGSNITTGTVSGDRIKFGEIEGVNIKGSEFDVTANLNIIPPPLDTDGDGEDDLMPYEQHATINFINPKDKDKLDSQLFVVKRKSMFPDWEYDPELYCNSNFGVNGEIQVGVPLSDSAGAGYFTTINPAYVSTPRMISVDGSIQQLNTRYVLTDSIESATEGVPFTLESRDTLYLTGENYTIMSSLSDMLIQSGRNLFIDAENIFFNYDNGIPNYNKLYYFGGTVTAMALDVPRINTREEFLKVAKQHPYDKNKLVNLGSTLHYNSERPNGQNVYTVADTIRLDNSGNFTFYLPSNTILFNGYVIAGLTPIGGTVSCTSKGASSFTLSGTPGIAVDVYVVLNVY